MRTCEGPIAAEAIGLGGSIQVELVNDGRHFFKVEAAAEVKIGGVSGAK